MVPTAESWTRDRRAHETSDMNVPRAVMLLLFAHAVAWVLSMPLVGQTPTFQNPNAIVSTILRIEPPLDRSPAELLRSDRGITIELEAGQRIRLDPADSRSAGYAQILNVLRELRQPVYVEVDPATSTLTRLLIPHVSRIVRLHQIDGGVGVELELSHGRHVLRREAADFGEIEERLRQAVSTGGTVILTEDDSHNIIDVRSLTRR
jgi:hypothetical protein